MTQLYEPDTQSTGPLDREPVVIVLSAAGAMVSAGLLVTNALNWTQLDVNQTSAIIAFVALVTGVLIAAIRGQVWSPATHTQAVDVALATPPPAPPLAIHPDTDTLDL